MRDHALPQYKAQYSLPIQSIPTLNRKAGTSACCWKYDAASNLLSRSQTHADSSDLQLNDTAAFCDSPGSLHQWVYVFRGGRLWGVPEDPHPRPAQRPRSSCRFCSSNSTGHLCKPPLAAPVRRIQVFISPQVQNRGSARCVLHFAPNISR